jgi:8-oxo-dGTP diphosphatase
MNSSVPQFGISHPTARYILRPGGYAIITRSPHEIAVLQTPRGQYLPGGGQNENESPQDAAIREALEECGLHIRISSEIGVADQLVYAADEKIYFRKRCTFFKATLASEDRNDGEPGTILIWTTPEAAAQNLLHESQRWAVVQAFSL